MNRLLLLLLIPLIQSCATAHAQVNLTSSTITTRLCNDGKYRTGPCDAPTSTVLFRDNFDSHADWYPEQMESGCNASACDKAPPGDWDYWRVDEYWNKYDPASSSPSSEPTGQITAAFGYRGASGKALVIHNESNSGRGGDDWGADFVLAKDLGDSYQEVWVTMWVKFQNGWNWDSTRGSSIKIIGSTHWQRTSGDLVFSYFTGGDNGPNLIYDFGSNPTFGLRHVVVPRCSPVSTDYTCGPAGGPQGEASNPVQSGLAWTDYVGDGQWHMVEMHLKMNSAAGVEDGVIQIYIDGGTWSWERTNQNFVKSGDVSAAHWNIIRIAGNAYNYWDRNEANKSEQYYLIDDVTISTERCTDAGWCQ